MEDQNNPLEDRKKDNENPQIEGTSNPQNEDNHTPETPVIPAAPAMPSLSNETPFATPQVHHVDTALVMQTVEEIKKEIGKWSLAKQV